MSTHLTDLTWPAVRQAVDEGSVVVVPVGAMEQHGHHLPLSVDWRLCAAVAERASQHAATKGARTLVTPPIWIGFSPHHMDFPGSLTLDAVTFMSLVSQVARGLWHHGFRRILLLNGHGGNTHMLRSAVLDLYFSHGVRAVAANYWDLALGDIGAWRESGPGGINHACEMETSLMMAVHPELVGPEPAPDHIFDPQMPCVSGDLLRAAPVTAAFSFTELTESGHLGEPSRASRQRGEELLGRITERVGDFLVQLSVWDPAVRP